MFVITDEQYKKLLEILPEEADRLVSDGDLNQLLAALHDEITALFDEDDEPTEESNRAEALMDEIYWQNVH